MAASNFGEGNWGNGGKLYKFLILEVGHRILPRKYSNTQERSSTTHAIETQGSAPPLLMTFEPIQRHPQPATHLPCKPLGPLWLNETSRSTGDAGRPRTSRLGPGAASGASVSSGPMACTGRMPAPGATRGWPCATKKNAKKRTQKNLQKKHQPHL